MRTYTILSLVLLTALPWSLKAQTGFTTLPAREKTRLAKQEELQSESDIEFQKIMSRGMFHFEEQQFENALEAFSEAAEKRPLNVYPPVMIEDVKLAIELYVEAEPEKEVETPEEIKPQTPELTTDERVAIMYEKEMAKVRQGIPPPPKEKDPDKEPLKNEVKRDAEGLVIFEGEGGEIQPKTEEPVSDSDNIKEDELQEVKPKTIPEKVIPKAETLTPKVDKPKTEPAETDVKIQERLAAEYKDGITETTFKEGNKEVVQRVVVKDGLGNEYRRVKHPWGGVFYFKNGTSITERVWNEETK